MNFYRSILVAASLLLSLLETMAIPDASLKLWYNRPAENWNEALPLGNGRLAAMVFGIPSIEHLQLNEETIWAGSPNNNANPDALTAIPVIRKLVFEGKYLEAQTMASEKVMSSTNHGMPYQTMGDLYISFPGHNHYSDYYRDLNLNNAIASVVYTANGVTYRRETFVSFTDQAIVVHLTASKPNSITCNVMLTSPQENRDCKMLNGNIVVSGITMTHEGQKGKVAFQARVKAKTNGGTVVANDGILAIDNASEVTLYIAIATNFKNYRELTVDEAAKSEAQLNQASLKDYEQAKADHIAYYQKYFNRVSLNLGTTDSVRNTTNTRIRDFGKGYDPQLATLYFQFGRYLLISSSQPGCQPANLQGKWCDRILPPWDSKYTTNINAEMNYWPAEVANLTELHEPWLQMIRELSESGAQTARIMYGARGWVLHHNTDIWRITGAVDHAPSGMWASGGAWACHHLWEHYQYTGDKAFLASAYPIMKGAAQFFLDVMTEEPAHHWMVVCPSSSPENTHAGSKGKATTAAGCTMDNQLIFDLFTNILRASDLLNTDNAFADSVKVMRDRMAPMQIGQYSQLQEWMNDWDDPKDIHRHVSHLWGLFPGSQISPYSTPELFDAARTSLIYRGDPSTGWSMGWKVCLWARLLDGNHAYKLLTNQINLVTAEQKKTGGTYANMFDAHPPFQIDGNFGCTAGIAEMLVQSHDGFVYILPAVPDVWKSGSVSGLIARGGFEVNISWKDGKIEHLTIVSKLGGNCRIRINNPIRAVQGAVAKKAAGPNPNPFFMVAGGKKPLISEKAKLNPVGIKASLEYDIPTVAGVSYHFDGI